MVNTLATYTEISSLNVLNKCLNSGSEFKACIKAPLILFQQLVNRSNAALITKLLVYKEALTVLIIIIEI